MDSTWIPLTSLQTPVLQNNLSYLQTRNHELLNLFQNRSFSEPLFFQKRGPWIRCRIDSQPPEWIFGETDTGDEMNRLRLRFASLPQQGILLLIGGTIGYGVAALIPALIQNPALRVVVIEPSRERIIACFALLDLQSALVSERLHFLVSELEASRILEKLEPLNLWEIAPIHIICSGELENRIDRQKLENLYRETAERSLEKKKQKLLELRSLHSSPSTLQRVLLINCWQNAPGEVHLRAIAQALQKRGIQIHILTFNRYRFDAAEKEYQRQAEYRMLNTIHQFRPHGILSYGYHAPQFVSQDVFASIPSTWVQVVTNIAYYDELQYSGENTFLLDRNLIPIFQSRGYRHTHFIPLMADYVADTPVRTDGRFPIVFVGNSLGLSPGAVHLFMQKWVGRDALLEYIREAETVLSDFDRQANLYDYLNSHPFPQEVTLRESYEIFRYLLCQASAARRKTLLEKLVPWGLVLYGGDWDAYLPPNSPLRSCWRGMLPMKDEPAVFAMGKIFVNIQSVGHVTGPNMRFFNVAGYGAFQIGDMPQFDEYLQSDREMVYGSTLSDYVEKVRYYLDHPQERDVIRRCAQQRILQDWTYRNWVDRVLGTLHFPSSTESL